MSTMSGRGISSGRSLLLALRNRHYAVQSNVKRSFVSTKGSRARHPFWAKVSLLPGSLALSLGFSKAKEEQKSAAGSAEAPVDPSRALLQQADALYAQRDMHALYALLLPHADCDDAAILWRLCRAAVDKGKLIGKDPEKRLLYYEALGYITRAVQLDPNDFATHKWFGILLSYTGEYEGTKKKIGDAYRIRQHFQRALELNPDDATCYHLMGKWCMAFAEMPWWQHKIAAALFATPPSSTFDEALDYFVKAEQVEPGFYSANLLMIGKTYHLKGQNAEAGPYLLRAKNAPVVKPDDQETHKEALDLLKKLGLDK